MLEECTCTTYTSPCSFDQTVQDADSAGKGAKGFKAAKEADRKASAGNRSAWNTLFMRPDTVAAAIAEHYGVSRAELLDRDAAGDTAQQLTMIAYAILHAVCKIMLGFFWKSCDSSGTEL